MSKTNPKWPRPATAKAVAETIARVSGRAWADRSHLAPEVRKQLELAYGFSNAFFAACVSGEWHVVSSRIAALNAATPESFFEHRESIVPSLARDYVLRFANPVPVSVDHPAARRLRAMLAETPYHGKGGSKIYVIRGYDAPENDAHADANDEEKALIAYLAVRALRLSPNARRTFKDIAGSL